MMCTTVTEVGNGMKPILKHVYIRYTIRLCQPFLIVIFLQRLVKATKRSERNHFKRHPTRWKFRFAILVVVMLDKIFITTTYVYRNIFDKSVEVTTIQISIKKPMATISPV